MTDPTFTVDHDQLEQTFYWNSNRPLDANLLPSSLTRLVFGGEFITSPF